MKRIIPFVSILLICISLISPIFVYADDVTIGDNDIDIVSDDNIKLGKKLSILEALGDLIAEGVSSFTISNASSTDDYVDYLYDLIYSSVDAPSSYDNDLEFLTSFGDLQSLRNYINERSYFFAQNLVNKGITDGIDTLDDLFNQLLDYNVEYQPHKSTIGAFRNLAYRESENPQPSPDPQYNQYLEIMNGTGFDYYRNYYNYSYNRNNGFRGMVGSCEDYTLVYRFSSTMSQSDGAVTNFWSQNYYTYFCNPMTVYIYNNNGQYSFSLTTSYATKMLANYNNNTYQYNGGNGYILTQSPVITCYINGMDYKTSNVTFSYTGTLENCFKILSAHVKNIDVYVDGVPWSVPHNNIPETPNIDIDGFLKLQGQDNPVNYVFPQGTQIDYKKLYQVIKNAIDNDDPVDMTTINNNQTYKDSHDNVYSPTINNYFDDDDEDEDSFISDILDLATIPKFDVAYVHPIDEPFTNGMIIVQDGLSVIPSEILILFGAIFVLLLFVLMMNRFLE